MRLIEGIKHKGFPFVIPDSCRDDLPEFFKELGFTVGIEIGTWEGRFTEKFCQHGFKMYTVDPWMAHSKQSQNMQDARYGRAVQILAPYDCTIIRKTSMEALNDFQDETLDFVYIDGNHRYRQVHNDITGWEKKIRRGGIIAGHDYTYPSVTLRDISQAGQAVEAFLKGRNIDKFYVYGISNPIKETKNDQCLSWMFIKNW